MNHLTGSQGYLSHRRSSLPHSPMLPSHAVSPTRRHSTSNSLNHSPSLPPAPYGRRGSQSQHELSRSDSVGSTSLPPLSSSSSPGNSSMIGGGNIQVHLLSSNPLRTPCDYWWCMSVAMYDVCLQAEKPGKTIKMVDLYDLQEATGNDGPPISWNRGLLGSGAHGKVCVCNLQDCHFLP